MTMRQTLAVIFSAYWDRADLYTDVLSIESEKPSQRQLKLAFLREGRTVLAKPIESPDDMTTISDGFKQGLHNNLSNNSNLTAIQANTFVSRKAKLKFQAINMAYSLLSNEDSRHMYHEWRLWNPRLSPPPTLPPPQSDAASIMSDDSSRSSISSFGRRLSKTFGRRSRQSSPSPSRKPAIPSILKKPTYGSKAKRRRKKHAATAPPKQHRRKISWNEEVEELTILNLADLALNAAADDDDDAENNKYEEDYGTASIDDYDGYRNMDDDEDEDDDDYYLYSEDETSADSNDSAKENYTPGTGVGTGAGGALHHEPQISDPYGQQPEDWYDASNGISISRPPARQSRRDQFRKRFSKRSSSSKKGSVEFDLFGKDANVNNFQSLNSQTYMMNMEDDDGCGHGPSPINSPSRRSEFDSSMNKSVDSLMVILGGSYKGKNGSNNNINNNNINNNSKRSNKKNKNNKSQNTTNSKSNSSEEWNTFATRRSGPFIDNNETTRSSKKNKKTSSLSFKQTNSNDRVAATTPVQSNKKIENQITSPPRNKNNNNDNDTTNNLTDKLNSANILNDDGSLLSNEFPDWGSFPTITDNDHREYAAESDCGLGNTVDLAKGFQVSLSHFIRTAVDDMKEGLHIMGEHFEGTTNSNGITGNGQNSNTKEGSNFFFLEASEIDAMLGILKKEEDTANGNTNANANLPKKSDSKRLFKGFFSAS